MFLGGDPLSPYTVAASNRQKGSASVAAALTLASQQQDLHTYRLFDDGPAAKKKPSTGKGMNAPELVAKRKRVTDAFDRAGLMDTTITGSIWHGAREQQKQIDAYNLKHGTHVKGPFDSHPKDLLDFAAEDTMSGEPMNRRWRADPTTLEGAMARLDSLHKNDDSYWKHRESIKYKIQAASEKVDNPDPNQHTFGTSIYDLLGSEEQNAPGANPDPLGPKYLRNGKVGDYAALAQDVADNVTADVLGKPKVDVRQRHTERVASEIFPQAYGKGKPGDALDLGPLLMGLSPSEQERVAGQYQDIEDELRGKNPTRYDSAAGPVLEGDLRAVRHGLMIGGDPAGLLAQILQTAGSIGGNPQDEIQKQGDFAKTPNSLGEALLGSADPRDQRFAALDLLTQIATAKGIHTAATAGEHGIGNAVSEGITQGARESGVTGLGDTPLVDVARNVLKPGANTAKKEPPPPEGGQPVATEPPPTKPRSPKGKKNELLTEAIKGNLDATYEDLGVEKPVTTETASTEAPVRPTAAKEPTPTQDTGHGPQTPEKAMASFLGTEEPKAAETRIPGVDLEESKSAYVNQSGRVSVRTRVVSLSDLNASHDHGSFAENPNFPQELQPRDRSGQDQRIIVEDIARNLRPEDLLDDFKSNDRGAPIISSDGVVETGNGRVMGLRKAKESFPKQWKAYQDELKARHPEAAGIKDPVLVRERTTQMTPEERIAYTKDANKRVASGQSTISQAKSYSENLSIGTVNDIKPVGKTLGESLRSPANKHVVQSFVDSLDPADRAEFINSSTGDLSDHGYEVLEKSIQSRVLGGDAGAEAMRRLNEYDDLKRVNAGLDQSTLDIARAVDSFEKGKTTMDVRPAIGEAVNQIHRMKQANQKPSQWFKQGQIDGPPTEVMELGRAMAEAKSADAVADVVRRFVDEVTDDGGLFGELTQAPKDIAEAAQRATGKLPSRYQGGFVDAKTLVGTALVGAAVILGGPYLVKWLNDEGIPNELTASAIGVAALALVFRGRGISYGKFLAEAHAQFPDVPTEVLEHFYKNGEISVEKHPEIAMATLDPKELATRLQAIGEKTGSRVTKLMGQALDTIVSSQRKYTLDASVKMREMQVAMSEHFGDAKGKINWNDPELRDLDKNVRDRVERAHLEGVPESEWVKNGVVTEKQMAFLTDLQKLGDKILDKADELGKLVNVRNDGTQRLKAGDRDVIIKGGRRGKIIHEEFPSFSSDDPFNPANQITDLESRLNALQNENVGERKALEALLERTKKGDVPTLIVELENGEIYRLPPGERFSRSVSRIGLGYVPRIYSDNFLQRIKSDKSAEFQTALAKMLEDENGLDKAESDQALASIGRVAENLQTEHDFFNFAANLERERQLHLARFEYTDADGNVVVVDPYDSSLTKSWGSYIDRTSKVLAIAEQLGPDPAALSSMLRTVEQSGKDGQIWANYMRKVIGRTLNVGPEAVRHGAFTNIARGEGAWQSISKLTGGTTHIAQASDILYSGTRADVSNLVKGIARFWTDSDLRADVRTAAAIDRIYLADLEVGDRAASKVGAFREKFSDAKGGSAKMQAVADAIWTAVGLKHLDYGIKIQASIIALQDASATLRRGLALEKAGKTMPADMVRKLDRYGIGEEELAKARSSGVDTLFKDPDFQAEFYGQFRRDLIYSGAAVDNPIWMATPAGALATRFRRPLYVATRFLLRDVLSEAARGNAKPLLRFIAYGVGGGALATSLKQGLTGRYEWDKTFLSKAFRGDLIGALMQSGQHLYDAGGLGIFGEFTPYNRRVKGERGEIDPIKAIEPVSVADVHNLLETAAKMSQHDNDEKIADAYDLAQSEFALFRTATRALNINPDAVRLRDLNRKADRAQRGEGPPLDEHELEVLSQLQAQKAVNYPKEKTKRKPSDVTSYMKAKGLNRDGTPVKTPAAKPKLGLFNSPAPATKPSKGKPKLKLF